ncbi:hypothetical protein DFH27DRAFT_359130 [Peziza echinospora]|nr:hypothetical protein DFH27DRAFT_359130 [Peziza echinospora]
MSRFSEVFHNDVLNIPAKQSQVTATTRECGPDGEECAPKPAGEAFILDEVEEFTSGTESTVEEFGRQSSNLSSPAMELGESTATPTLSLLSALARYKGKSRDALSALERFALNAMVESYCAQRVSMHLPSNVSHQTHEACKAELYTRVSRILGIDGGFSREEFKATRISVMEEISQLVESELLIMAGHSTHPAAFIAPSPPPPQKGFEPADKSVVRRMHRQTSFERLPQLVHGAQHHLALDHGRPSTSDGRRPRAGGIYTVKPEDRGHPIDTRRPELTRAVSYDTLHHSQKGGTRTPPLGGHSFVGGTSAFFGYKSPQQQRSPSMGARNFRPRAFGHSTPPLEPEGFAPSHQSQRSIGGTNTSHISNMGAIRASRSLHRLHSQPMDNSFQSALTISNRPKTPTAASFHLSSAITKRASRYQSDYVELDFLGKGGFASVYKAKNRVDGRIYAVKKVPIRNKHLNSTNQDRLEAIFRESRALSKLEHQNVVRYFSAWVEGADGLWGQGNTGTFFSRATVADSVEPPLMSKLKLQSEGKANSKIFRGNKSPLSVTKGEESFTTSRYSDSDITSSREADVEDQETSDDMGIVFGEDSCDTTGDSSPKSVEHRVANKKGMKNVRPLCKRISIRDISSHQFDDDSRDDSTEKETRDNSLDEDSQDEVTDDGLGIVFGEDTQDDSTEMHSRDETSVDDSCDDDEDSVDPAEAGEEDDDVEDIPRSSFLPSDIPLPDSPYFPPAEYFRERRRSFVSAVDDEGNELPFAESFAGASASSESEVELNMLEQLRIETERKQAFIQSLRKENQRTSAKNVTVLDPTESLDESKTEDKTEDDSSSSASSEDSYLHRKPTNRSTKLKPSQSMLKLMQAEKLAKKKLDRTEVLTLMILMSCHPLTLKDFLGTAPANSSQSVTPNKNAPYGQSENIHRSEIEHIKHCGHLQGTLRLFKGITDGVEYLHRKGIVHRDLKPGNIFLDIEGQLQTPHLGKDGRVVKNVAVDNCGYCGHDTIRVIPRIGDFGLVVDLVEGLRKNSSSGSGSPGSVGTPGSVSTPGTDYPEEDDVVRGGVVGTALYRPPPCTVNEVEDICSSSEGERSKARHSQFFPPPKESKKGDNRRNIICPKTDVFALGIILFELLYHFETGSERVRCITSLRDQRVLPRDWEAVVLRAAGGKDCPYKDQLKKLGDCVLGMTEPRRARRWGLKRVLGELKQLGMDGN